MKASQRGHIRPLTGRIGDCDGRNLHGCGRTHSAPERPDDIAAWYQDEECHTWCVYRVLDANVIRAHVLTVCFARFSQAVQFMRHRAPRELRAVWQGAHVRRVRQAARGQAEAL